MENTITTLRNNYTIAFENELRDEEKECLLKSVKKIQSSIEWDDLDYHYAKLRMLDSKCPKALVKDIKSNELLGYATIVQKTRNLWYISQIAVNQSIQNNGIGKNILNTILENAQIRHIKEVYLETDEEDSKLIRFYKSVSNIVTVETINAGKNRFGRDKVIIKYTFNSEDET